MSEIIIPPFKMFFNCTFKRLVFVVFYVFSFNQKEKELLQNESCAAALFWGSGVGAGGQSLGVAGVGPAQHPDAAGAGRDQKE